MSDIRTLWNPDTLHAEWLLNGSVLDTGRDLETAFVISLMTDALADENDVLPDPTDDDRRGWWADWQAADIWGAPPIGSKLWLLRREKWTEAVRLRAEDYVRTGLAWFLDEKIGTRLDVSAVRAEIGVIEVTVTAYRGPEQLVALRFRTLWD
ncbi:phage GP46 family protein [Ancylobacter oerskovii]|uniref:Phage GP46 family protein n=1 Tax=Ancylobacter oerskovii TaxID=459519 RepID=A0ABW4Z345_9HYPH|nr:phage GP46 family protein [Ancylobacter oerskovii]MBS7546254.1 phage GP46 family protein [Ancylobacter oerskovii]